MSDKSPDTRAEAVRRRIGPRNVAVIVPDAADRAAVEAILGGFPRIGEAAPDEATYTLRRAAAGGWEFWSGGTRTHQATTLEDGLLALEWQVVTDLLAQTDDRFHLHGAALADPSSTFSVLVLGESGVGKTTLTLALIAAGFKPYTDDVILLAPASLVPATFERAFHVDATTRALADGLPHDPAWEVPGVPDGYFLPATWAREPLPVRVVIVPKARDHERPLLVGLPIAEAATTILGFSGSLEHAPALALRTAARLTAAAPCYALYAGPLARTAQFLAEAVEGLRLGK
ncbi:MAG: hypothetical protein AB7H81_25485 [Vicinamibacterales bacterium]